ncbi:MAG: rhomboid family intramembrane serine protease [Chitinophagaceae bacterium]|nr:rhomboid family intramembrane serine protease [Chitinophagaceae bacterium]MCW5928786.1 rhomboid family intramembrane serine protease [Chitinophagaceae bacterium]
MLLPVGDDNSDRVITPYINYILIALNIFVFLFFQWGGFNVGFTHAFSTVPAEILTGRDIVTAGEIIRDQATGYTYQIPGLQPTPIPVYFTLITSMFMHGGWAHLAGNMLYLWIFGDNIENRLGHFRYLVFYLLCGVLASLSHVFATVIQAQNSLIPSLGASGAISGVLGAYLLLFPGRKVHAVFLIFIISIPAVLALGLWIVFQVVSGLGMLGDEESGGVAYAAHIGGFIAGFILIKMFDPVKQTVRNSPFIERRRSR